MDYSKYISVTEDWPGKGVSFKDISPLLRDPEAFHSCIDDLAALAEEYHPDIIIGPESRGFIFGAALAYQMNVGFVMARKSGKLPGVIYQISYQLEYGSATLCIPKNSFKPGQRVLLVDDLLATGGTVNAIQELVEIAGGTPVAAIAVIKLEDLHGDENIHLPFKSLLNL